MQECERPYRMQNSNMNATCTRLMQEKAIEVRGCREGNRRLAAKIQHISIGCSVV